MSWVDTKLVLNNQDVEEGQLPNCGNPQPNNVPFQNIDQRRKHYYNEERPQNPTAETAPDHHLHPEEPLHQLPPPHSEIEYETVLPKISRKDYSHSPDKKKKSHKSEHHSKHHHRPHTHDKDREKQINRQYSRERDKEIYMNDKRRFNQRLPREEGPPDNSFKPEFYPPPPPYYPPYMYPPPPPNMYPYQIPPHCLPPPSYPYGGMPMMPPMGIPPPLPEFHPHREIEKNELPPGSHEIDETASKRSKKVKSKREDCGVENQEEGDDKMFGMRGHYMYPYPPPPIGYPGYPPPGYMMYPQEAYYQGSEQDDQLRSWRRRELVDNQKQRVRKALKHLSLELKIEMLDTFRIIIKLQKIVMRTGNSQSLQNSGPHDSHEALLQGTAEKCYQKNVCKVEKWLKEDDPRIREAVKYLVIALQMEGIEDRIREIQELRQAQSESLQSVTKSLLDRLIKSRRQVVF